MREPLGLCFTEKHKENIHLNYLDEIPGLDTPPLAVSHELDQALSPLVPLYALVATAASTGTHAGHTLRVHEAIETVLTTASLGGILGEATVASLSLVCAARNCEKILDSKNSQLLFKIIVSNFRNENERSSFLCSFISIIFIVYFYFVVLSLLSYK